MKSIVLIVTLNVFYCIFCCSTHFVINTSASHNFFFLIALINWEIFNPHINCTTGKFFIRPWLKLMVTSLFCITAFHPLCFEHNLMQSTRETSPVGKWTPRASCNSINGQYYWPVSKQKTTRLSPTRCPFHFCLISTCSSGRGHLKSYQAGLVALLSAQYLLCTDCSLSQSTGHIKSPSEIQGRHWCQNNEQLFPHRQLSDVGSLIYTLLCHWQPPQVCVCVCVSVNTHSFSTSKTIIDNICDD